MGKRLLFITRHRLSENNGGANGSKGFIRCFAALFDNCSIIFPELEDTASVIPSCYKLFPCHDGRYKIQKGLDCYRAILSPLARFALSHLKGHTYDVVVIDHSFIATKPLIRAIKESGAKLITIHHNVERDYLNDNRRQFSLAFRIPYIYYAKKAERDSLRGSDVNLTVTERDAEVFRTWYEGLNVYPWGNYEYKPIPDKTFARQTSTRTFIITGSLCFIQSLQPILEFVARYWPIVIAHHPDARLLIAGRNPSPKLLQVCAQQPAVNIIPNPKNMEILVQSADYYICPINAGSGRKLRVMDGLRQGLPVLCHEVALSGYESMQESHCLFPYHDEVSFEKSMEQMMTTEHHPQSIYQSFKEHFSIEAGTARLSEILKQNAII